MSAPKTPAVSSFTHQLSLKIQRPHAVVWRAFTEEAAAWWPADFFGTPEPHKMVFEARVGGRLYEDNGSGNGLVWYQVISMDAPNSVLLSGVVAPPHGGPLTTLLRLNFTPAGKNATQLEMIDSLFGCVGDQTCTSEGWKMLFEGGFKAYVEAKPK